MGFIVINSLDEFYSEIMKKNNNLVIAYFTASWCGPCKNISPIVKNIGENNEHITVLKIDVDECEEVSTQCNIQCMPTFNFYRNCNLEPCDTMSGADKQKLLTTIQNIFDEMEKENIEKEKTHSQEQINQNQNQYGHHDNSVYNQEAIQDLGQNINEKLNNMTFNQNF